MMTLNEIRKLRGMTLSEFSRQSGLSPHTAREAEFIYIIAPLPSFFK